ncbi:MAG: flagellar hook-associated protein FlgL [Burkholderiales bacterium]|nr:flagellar hook-associated protein FlgL [Burkholderiales bacterium]
MRISTLTFATAALQGIQNEQAAIARLSQQITSGKRVLASKDDPAASAQIIFLGERIAQREQYLINQDRAESALRSQMTVLAEIRRTLQHARQLLTSVSPDHELALRQQHAVMLMGDYLHLKGLLNARDPEGNYLFAGHQTDIMPFIHTQMAPGPGVSPNSTYMGDSGERTVTIAEGRSIQINALLIDVADAGLPNDLMQGLDQVAIDLRQPVLTQAQLDTAITRLDAALSALGEVEQRSAGALQEVIDARATTRALLNQERDALARLSELDQAAAIVELQRRQVTLEAAQRAHARIAGLSLFNYL